MLLGLHLSNIPSLNDKWYHSYIDKINLACIGLLGPDYLLAIALGQLSSARRSVKLPRFLTNNPAPLQSRHPKTTEWTLVHGFYADMGGNGHVEFPTLKKFDIKAQNEADNLSKSVTLNLKQMMLITLWKVLWFTVSELQRVAQGLSMTTLELTALTFSITMSITSLCWFAKPTISVPTMLHTKGGRSIEEIRNMANPSRASLSTWYRTPLDFVSPNRRFQPDNLPVLLPGDFVQNQAPPVLTRHQGNPRDRFPSDAILVPDRVFLVPALISTVYHAMSTGVYGVCSSWPLHENWKDEDPSRQPTEHSHRQQHRGGTPARRPEVEQQTGLSKTFYDVKADSASSRGQIHGRVKGLLRAFAAWVKRKRVILPDGDPDTGLGLHVIVLPLIGTDFVSIREQPVGVYIAVNRFVPFLGS
ncbi:hypothetical protein N657DRAFT_655003 [Parathielavia appendiculata]|uniref:Uncharacterized protein n=1 Tax=Parathielavia appendiculata TaxID=2587402 RepID=A0AAN6Z4L2_9PEZI|nr:hypothetical protein N657DRAFT_655003 [Parathielavia appendiculata]